MFVACIGSFFGGVGLTLTYFALRKKLRKVQDVKQASVSAWYTVAERLIMQPNKGKFGKRQDRTSNGHIIYGGAGQPYKTLEFKLDDNYTLVLCDMTCKNFDIYKGEEFIASFSYTSEMCESVAGLFAHENIAQDFTISVL